MAWKCDRKNLRKTQKWKALLLIELWFYVFWEHQFDALDTNNVDITDVLVIVISAILCRKPT